MSRPVAQPRATGRKAAKRARQQKRQAAKSNLPRLYRLCLARCAGDLAAAAKLFQTTGEQFPKMTVPIQEHLLAQMDKSIAQLRKDGLLPQVPAGQ